MHSYCFRCGRDLTPGKTHCTKCGALMWTGPRFTSFPRWATAGRLRWRRYRRIRTARGERECFQARLPAASVYTVDRQANLGAPVACTVTEKRIVVQGALGRCDLPLDRIRAAHARREWDHPTGFRFWVAVDKTRSACTDNRGDLCLWCKGAEQSEALAASILTARASA